MAYDLDALPAGYLASLDEMQLAVLAVPRPGRAPHATVVGFTYDPRTRIARIISRDGTRKQANIGDGAPVSLTSHAGRHWMTLEGRATVTHDPDGVAEAVRRYEARYRPAGDVPGRHAIEIRVERAYGMYE